MQLRFRGFTGRRDGERVTLVCNRCQETLSVIITNHEISAGDVARLMSWATEHGERHPEPTRGSA